MPQSAVQEKINSLGIGDDAAESDRFDLETEGHDEPKDPQDKAAGETGAAAGDDGTDPESGDDNSAGEEDAVENGKGDEPAPELSDELRERATAAGLTEEDLDGLDEHQAESMVNSLERAVDREIAKIGQQANEKANAKPDTGEAAPANEPAAPKPEKAAKVEPATPFKLELDEEMLEPDVAKAFTAMADRINTMQAMLDERQQSVGSELQQTISALQSQLAEMQSEREANRYSEMFTSIEDGKELFGTSNKTTAEQRSNRERVVESVKALRAGYKALNRDVPSDSELFERALRSEFGTNLQTAARRRVVRQARNGTGRFISKPTARQGTPEPPQKRAVQKVGEKLKSLGLDEAADENESFLGT